MVLHLLLWNLDLTLVDAVNDVVWWLSVDCAADRLASSENLLDGTAQLLGQRLVSHGSCNADDLVEGNVTGVSDVLDLLSVTGCL